MIIETNQEEKELETENNDRMVTKMTPRRVKVYILQDNEWKDTGTGHCVGTIIDNVPYMLVNNEVDTNTTLLRSKIGGNIEYQRQEETLIVWKDNQNNDIALSFEESVGCDDICNFLIHIQKTLENNISLVAVRSDHDPLNGSGTGATTAVHEMIAGPVQLPSMDQTQDDIILLESLKILNDNTMFEFLKNETIHWYFNSSYLSNILIPQFNLSEQNHLIKNLFLLSNIIKTLILYNQKEIIDQFIQDEETFSSIIGILEYDTEFPDSKATHRSYLAHSNNPALSLSPTCSSTSSSEPSIYKEIIPLENEHLKIYIKKYFKLQFLKDIVLVRFIDDHNYCLINEMSLDLQAQIIDLLQTDAYLDKIFELYRTPVIENDEDFKLKKKYGIRLLHQFIEMTKNLNSVEKNDFFKFLIQKGFYKIIDYAFNIEKDNNLRILATDSLITIMEHDIFLLSNINVADEISNTNTNSIPDMTLLKLLSNILLNDKSPGLKEQIVQALYTLLQPSNSSITGNNFDYEEEDMHTNGNNEFHGNNQQFVSNPNSIHDEEDIIEYLQLFYKEIAPILFDPLINYKVHSSNGESSNRIEDEQLLIHLIKLITFIITEHDKRLSRNFTLENSILVNISRTINCNENHILQLRLTSIRCFKTIICLDDDYYNRYIISNNLFSPIMGLLVENIGLNNLANSTMQDFFKIILINCKQLDNIEREREATVDGYEDLSKTSLNDNEKRFIHKSNFILLNKYMFENFSNIFEKIDDMPYLTELANYK
ncbi:hypothetical protein TBLA_0B00360 [Henningerozyma blattae CBS 6284]|uniref:Serine/threonine-protein phosphatase 4 regulatory subunit 3-like central domain-containing protein n=1 Tax=Henningerozyma blattae (strain ATCC 34711 / CBS 6284 / DSM 70876 / NBRC 10599 / NRRL Y-10934 / UCD 77-7) TaxID=1071380 RepID=I2GXM9_HENB6|nr:hypothetical protein TBLA_0B00360 [Tetrapisispora blattae CBS 6284]CCH58881.1 hypothetical protein TBLA_0B00360 [Tetrapisispora blattae CBS 6284]